jgi:hypothetical protein
MRAGWRTRRHSFIMISGIAAFLSLGMAVSWIAGPAYAIDVKLTMDEAKKALIAGRQPLEKVKNQEDATKIGQQIFAAYRVGADPEKEPCAPSAVLHTKRYWLEWFGGVEAAESKKKKEAVRMPDAKVQTLLDMPNMEIEVHFCGDDEYFAEGAEMVLRQGTKTIKPVDASPPPKGREVKGKGKTYHSQVTARFAYDGFDPSAKTKIVITFPDGKLTEVDADFSKVK